MKYPLMKWNWLVLLMLGVTLSGCVSQRAEWSHRIGAYTFDQAVLDYGPPDKQARLSDGRLVAEWISRYSSPGTVMIGPSLWDYPYGGGFVQSFGPDYYESKLRLTFSTNNLLTAWSKD